MKKVLRTRILALPRPVKQLIIIFFDIVILAFAAWLAFCLRLNILLIPDQYQFLVIILAPIIAVPVFIRLGLYRAVIRYLPERVLWTILNAVALATLIWIATLFILEIINITIVPRSVPIIYGALVVILIGGSRFMAKYLLGMTSQIQTKNQVVIYGAGTAGAQLANALHSEGKKQVIGFLDDDTSLHGRDVSGLKVYPPEKLAFLINNMGCSTVILSMPSLSLPRNKEIISNLSSFQVKIRTLPALSDLTNGKYLISQIKEIELGDILGRSSVAPENGILENMIAGRSILVSGAGGSIGSELCKLIIKWKPRKLVLLEANEYFLYQIERALKKHTDVPIVATLGSVTDPVLVSRVLKQETVDVVFHAAAHKHVPLVEANTLEGVRNNVFGTQTIAQQAFEAGVEQFVLISTDKAVRPTNVMGATKRWAELIVRNFSDQAIANKTGQRFCSVRFGNVLGSNGSVVPLFKEQIAQGGPITITDPEMTRYFMSIHEAAELIIQAGGLSRGGDTFILEMGNPVNIADLATNMIQLAGLTIKSQENPSGDIAIDIVGRRPGEKIHEELFYDTKEVMETRLEKILRSPQEQNLKTPLSNELEKLHKEFNAEDEAALRKILFGLISDNDEMPEKAPTLLTLVT